MGTTQAFYALTANQTYFKNKWSLFIALAPPLSLRGQKNSPVIKFLTDETTSSIIANTFRMFKIFELYPSNWINSGIFKSLCASLYDICQLG